MKYLQILIILFFFIFGFTNTHAHAASEGWIIKEFNSKIEIKKDGIVHIDEAIIVDFGNLSKHGIYRTIPYIYKSETQRIETPITISTVQMDGNPISYTTTTTQMNGDLEIKIGDADRTIDGEHVYDISYDVSGILKSYDSYDELYWNVTGNGWGVPILNASAQVILPSDGLIKITCFEGYLKMNESCKSIMLNQNTATFSTNRVLNEEEGLTVVAGFKKGLVPIIAPLEYKEPLLQILKYGLLFNAIIFIVGSVGGFIIIWFLWFRNGRDLWFGDGMFDSSKKESVHPFGGHETIVVEYEPPEKLRPAEIGVLMDERADTLDVTATIVDLATRGFLLIEEKQKKWIFGSTDYVLTKKKKDTTELLPYEEKLLTSLFDGKDSVSVSELKLSFYKELMEVKEKLYEDIVEKKFFVGNPDVIRKNYAIAGIVMIAVSFFLLVTFGFLLFGLFCSLIVIGIIILIFSQFMPKRTGVGRDLFRRSKGYRLFISGAEKYKQQFYEKKNMFNEIMPYAIVFGLTDKFAAAMKNMGIKPTNTSWYVGSHPFDPVYFSSSINSFSSSVSSSIASSPRSSGFSSGGGFSGGGFGGGGGGSW